MSRSERDRAVEALCDGSLAHIVDLVAYTEVEAGERSVTVANAAGAARLRLGAARLRLGAADELLWGRSPVADQDPMAFLPYRVEVDDPSPPNQRNAYPYAAERMLSLFSDPRAPDLAVVHTPGHYFPERGGHRGEHGSLDVLQSRAPLLLSGAGITARGLLDDHARVVDIGPTLCWLAGVPADSMTGLDGAPLTRFGEPGAPFVVGLLWDGATSGDLLHLTETGELPNVARLLDRGCALRGGAIAEFPSVTLCNHTSALTGVGPGRHGVIGNVFWDRQAGAVAVPNDPTTWHRSAQWLRPGVTTVYERIAAARPGALTAGVNEPIDRGAGYSTMALIRAQGSNGGAGAMTSLLPDPAASRYGSRSWVGKHPAYAWGTQVDDAGLDQVLQLWQNAAGAPAFLWWNNTLTDSASHAGGPRSPIARAGVRDADRRLGVFLDRLQALGVYDDVAFLLTADHGFEGADEDCRGDWDPALTRSGLTFRDEGPGFVYLGTSDRPQHGIVGDT